MRFGSKIFALALVIIFVALFLTSLIMHKYIIESFSYNNEQLALSQAEILARQVKDLLDTKQQIIVLLGSVALADYITSLQGQNKEDIEKKRKKAEVKIKVFAEQFDFFTELRFIDSSGDVLIKILNGKVVDKPGENVSGKDYFNFLISSNKDRKNYKYISPVFKSEQSLAVNIACLVNYKEKDIGLIVATYNLEDICDLFIDVKFKRVWAGENSFAWLIGSDMDGKGQLISFPAVFTSDSSLMSILEEDKNFAIQEGILKGGDRCIRYASRSDNERIIAFTPVNKTSGWSVAISIPYRTFFSSAERLQIKLLIILTVAFLVIIISIFIVFLNFTRYLTLLSHDVEVLVELEQQSELKIKGQNELSDIAGFINKLNQKYLDLKKQGSSDLNSITNLPGNLTVQKKLFDIIDSGKKFAVAMVDIDNFNVYNQRYGFLKGDSIIRMTATLVTNIVKEFGNKEDFVGHLGGDDIVFITTTDKVDRICNEIISAFDRQILLYYDREDREKGGFAWRDKEGIIRKFPVMTLSIAVSTNEKRQVIHPLQISQIFSELLVYLKKQEGSKYFKDRRTTDRKPLSTETASKMRKEEDEKSEEKQTEGIKTEDEKATEKIEDKENDNT